MKRTIELAKKGIGFVNPGPLAGAVVVKDEIIVGEGYCNTYGMEAAEILALKNAKLSSAGGEIYLNIWTRENWPDSNAWTQLIIDSGIKKLYIGLINTFGDGSWLILFRSLGIEVETGVLKDECEELNEIYTHYVTKGTPFVFVKWAMTLDGKLASRTGDSKWISSDESLKFVHNLRQRVAAIMVGENTVRLDNPLLTTRLEGVELSNPLRIVLSKYGDLPLESKIFEIDDKAKTLIISSINISLQREKLILKTGATLLKLEEKNGRLDFNDIIKVLGEKKIDSLYIEGGSGVLGSAFESGVINKVYAAIAPKIIGGKTAVTPVGGVGIEKMRDAIVLKKVSHEIIGSDVIIKGYL